jgi:hypothetical protein
LVLLVTSVSSPSLDVQLYYIRKEEDGLNIYRCARGTNSVEGSIHQKIVQAFGTYNAGPALADDLLAEFRHRHNEDASRRNRPNYLDVGHYDTWMVDDLQNVMIELGFQNPFPNWVNSSSFKPTNEAFGIVPLAAIPEHMKYDKNRNDGMAPANLKLAIKMKVRFPFLPIHSDEERRLYRRILRQNSGQGKPDFITFADQWNQEADGKTIFYKKPVHFEVYAKALAKSQNIRASVARGQTSIAIVVARNEAIARIQPANVGSSVNVPIRSDGNFLRPGTATAAPLLPPTSSPHVLEAAKRPGSRKPRTCRLCRRECPGNAGIQKCKNSTSEEIDAFLASDQNGIREHIQKRRRANIPQESQVATDTAATSSHIQG